MSAQRPLHVAIAIHRLFPHGGLQRDAAATARTLVARGHRVTLLCQKMEGELPEGTELHLCPGRGLSNHARARAFGEAVRSYRVNAAPGAAPNVIIGFDKLPGLDLYFAGDRCYAERVHATRPRWNRWTPRYRTFRALEEAVFRAGSSPSILLLRKSQEAVFRTWYGTEAERFEVLPPGVDRARVRPNDAGARRRAMRADHGIPDADPVMLFVGSDYARKGLDRAIGALAQWAAAGPRPWLVVAGADDAGPFLQRARAAGLQDRVLALGPRDDVLNLMLGADVLVHPARTEAGGVVLLEAIAAGTPVIASSVCGYGPIVSEAGAGVLIAEGPHEGTDDETFVRHLTEALASAFGPTGEGTRSRWREAAIRYTEASPELFQMHAHIADAIERVAQRQRSAP